MAVTNLLKYTKKSQVLINLVNTETGNTKQVLAADDYQAVTQELIMFATIEGISARQVDISISEAP